MGNNTLIVITTWLILLIITGLATNLIIEVLNIRKSDTNRLRANYIAIIIGLVLTVILFIQPYLDLVFDNKTPAFWINVLVFGGGAGVGWAIWYLKYLKNYGEFFYILLLTSVTGLCWYARLAAPKEVQLTAVAFLLGSLFNAYTDVVQNIL